MADTVGRGVPAGAAAAVMAGVVVAAVGLVVGGGVAGAGASVATLSTEVPGGSTVPTVSPVVGAGVTDSADLGSAVEGGGVEVRSDGPPQAAAATAAKVTARIQIYRYLNTPSPHNGHRMRRHRHEGKR